MWRILEYEWIGDDKLIMCVGRYILSYMNFSI